MPHSDTLHGLIKDYRDKKKIVLNLEHRLMQRMATDYDHLPLMKKVEVGIIIFMSHFLFINWTLSFILFFHCIIYSFKSFLLHLIAVKESQIYLRNQFFSKRSHVKYTFPAFQSTCLKTFVHEGPCFDYVSVILLNFDRLSNLVSNFNIQGVPSIGTHFRF